MRTKGKIEQVEKKEAFKPTKLFVNGRQVKLSPDAIFQVIDDTVYINDDVFKIRSSLLREMHRKSSVEVEIDEKDVRDWPEFEDDDDDTIECIPEHVEKLSEYVSN